MKNAEIRELSDRDLAERIDTDTQKLQQLRLSHAVTPLENPMQIKHLRRDIARMKTEQTARQNNKQ